MSRDFSDPNQITNLTNGGRTFDFSHMQNPINTRQSTFFAAPQRRWVPSSTPSAGIVSRGQAPVFSNSGNVTYSMSREEEPLGAWNENAWTENIATSTAFAQDQRQLIDPLAIQQMQLQQQQVKAQMATREEVWRNESGSFEVGAWSEQPRPLTPAAEFGMAAVNALRSESPSVFEPTTSAHMPSLHQEPMHHANHSIGMEQAVQVQMQMMRALEMKKRQEARDQRYWSVWSHSNTKPLDLDKLRAGDGDKDHRQHINEHPTLPLDKDWREKAAAQREAVTRAERDRDFRRSHRDKFSKDRERSRSPRSKDKDSREKDKDSRAKDTDSREKDKDDRKIQEEQKSDHHSSSREDGDKSKEIENEKEKEDEKERDNRKKKEETKQRNEEETDGDDEKKEEKSQPLEDSSAEPADSNEEKVDNSLVIPNTTLQDVQKSATPSESRNSQLASFEYQPPQPTEPSTSISNWAPLQAKEKEKCIEPEPKEGSTTKGPSPKKKNDIPLRVLSEAAFEDIHLFHKLPKKRWTVPKHNVVTFDGEGNEETGEKGKEAEDEERDRDAEDDESWRPKRMRDERWTVAYNNMVQQRRYATAQQIATSIQTGSPIQTSLRPSMPLLGARPAQPMHTSVPVSMMPQHPMMVQQIPSAQMPTRNGPLDIAPTAGLAPPTTSGAFPMPPLVRPIQTKVRNGPVFQSALTTSAGDPQTSLEASSGSSDNRPTLHSPTEDEKRLMQAQERERLIAIQREERMQELMRITQRGSHIGQEPHIVAQPMGQQMRSGPQVGHAPINAPIRDQMGGQSQTAQNADSEESKQKKSKRVPTIEEYIEYKKLFGNAARIDPRSFVEDLSDEEDWAEMLDMVATSSSSEQKKAPRTPNSEATRTSHLSGTADSGPVPSFAYPPGHPAAISGRRVPSGAHTSGDMQHTYMGAIGPTPSHMGSPFMSAINHPSHPVFQREQHMQMIQSQQQPPAHDSNYGPKRPTLLGGPKMQSRALPPSHSSGGHSISSRSMMALENYYGGQNSMINSAPTASNVPRGTAHASSLQHSADPTSLAHLHPSRPYPNRHFF